MILFTFKETPETRVGAHWPCQAFRWVLEACFEWERPFASFGVVHQYQRRETGEWHSSHTGVYEVTLSPTLGFGFDHFYYDGPHCMFSLGPVHLQWYNGNCKKCMDER